MIITARVVALDILNLWRTFLDGLVDDIENVAVQNVWKWYLIYNRNGWKTIPFGAAHVHIAHIREYSLPFAVNQGGFPVLVYVTVGTKPV